MFALLADLQTGIITKNLLLKLLVIRLKERNYFAKNYYLRFIASDLI